METRCNCLFNYFSISNVCLFVFMLISIYGAANLIRLEPGREKREKKKTIVNFDSHISLCMWYI